MSDKEQGPRLPPPAFPPGQRRYVQRSTTSNEGSIPAVRRSDSDEPIELLYDPIELAFISPDDPLPDRELTLEPEFEQRPPLKVEGAWSPSAEQAESEGVAGLVDAERDVDDDEETRTDGAAIEPGIDFGSIDEDGEEEDGDGVEGEVVGMDLDAHVRSRRKAAAALSRYDPHVVDLTDAVQRLGEALARHGEASLHTTSSMSALDQTLRAFCAGYLAGQRAERKPLAVKLSDDY